MGVLLEEHDSVFSDGRGVGAILFPPKITGIPFLLCDRPSWISNICLGKYKVSSANMTTVTRVKSGGRSSMPQTSGFV